MEESRREGKEIYIHFNEDGAKGQYPTKQHYVQRLHEPFLLWYRFGHCVDSAGVVRLTGDVTTQDSTHKVQWQDNKQADTRHRNLILGKDHQRHKHT